MAILFILNDMFRMHVLSSSDSANVHIPGCFCSWTFPLNMGFNISDSFMSCLDSLLGYSKGELRDEPLASCMLVHICENKFETKVGLKVWHNGEHLFRVFCLHFTYNLMPHCLITLYLPLPFFTSQLVLYCLTVYFSTRALLRCSLTLSIDKTLW